MFVCLTGIDGCGKTTQARLLTEWLCRERGIAASGFEVWDILKDPQLNKTGFMGKPEDLRAYLDALTPVSRSLFLFHALFEVLYRNLSREDQVLVASGYWPKYAISEVLQGTDAVLLDSLEPFFLEPDLTLVIDVDPRTAAERRTRFSRYECGGEEPGRESFEGFQARCQELYLGTAGERGWVVIDGTGSPEAVHAQVKKAVETALESEGLT